MTQKIVRGQLLVFTATPKDESGNIVSPDTMKLYLNYIHDDGIAETDEIDMDPMTDGTWIAEFDSKVARQGPAFASVRAANPPSAEDIKFTFTANAANPNDST